METAEYARMAAAEENHWWYRGLHDLVLRQVRPEAAKEARPLEILDAGCGTGRLCQLLEPFGQVTGCDFHPLAVEAATRRGLDRVRQCDLVNEALNEEQFDLITFVDVLYHRAVTDEVAVLRNLHRALKPRGLLILHVAAFEMLRGAHDLAVHTRRRYRKHEVVELLQSAGFTVEFASYRLPALFLPALVWRRFRQTASSGTTMTVENSDVALRWSSWVNLLFATCVKAENILLCSGIRLPLGTSIFVLARK